jgi:hypothetical protein
MLNCKYELETKEVLTYNIASLSNYILFFLPYNKKSKLGAERLLLKTSPTPHPEPSGS